jgi:hypothetical protein
VARVADRDRGPDDAADEQERDADPEETAAEARGREPARLGLLMRVALLVAL